MKDQIAAISAVLIQALSPALIALLGLIGVKVAALIQTKVKNTALQGILFRLDSTAIAAVKEVEQTFVSNLKKGTPDAFAKAKDMALSTIKAHMGTEGLAELQKILGLDDPAAVDKYLTTVLEAHVHDLNLVGGAA